MAVRDPSMAACIELVGPCRIRVGQGDYFAALVRSIAYQQLAGRAAAAIRAPQPGRSHQPSDPLLAHRQPVVVAQVKQDPRRTIGAVGLLVDPADPLQQVTSLRLVEIRGR